MRFTLRDLIWLTALLAVSLGWLVDRVALAVANEALRDRNYRVERDNSGLSTWVKNLQKKNAELQNRLSQPKP
jgi:hypothetical protein